MLRPISLLAAVLLLAGCAAPVPPRSPDLALDFAPTAAVEALRLPFDAYSYSLSELYTISNAEDVLTGECMRAKGLAWEVVDRPTDLPDLRNRRRYGVVEMRIAERVGYHVPAGLLTPVAVEQSYDQRESSLSEAQKAAAFGAGGCGPQASQRLRPDEDAGQGLLQRLDRGSLDDSQRDPRVAAALRSWRDCVRRLGFDYPDPFAAISDARWWADDAAGPSRQEVAVAVADVRCKEQTSLIEAWYAAELRIQQELVERNAVELRKVGAAMQKELAAAHAILGR
ncbi:hypothetical protein F4553_007033 [Allocatelliglobosispora scoriae]|uniref:Uncharacterized protein n=1 Tax=Allocatelliglobosispora scoriae TaxID=643052 RepID=A0A841C2R6_9ACTN|nr:hypothetical protein [Allocatelliglobosispora scoriae]MBB5873599.1 hypothetical protein [Allocatelliglobosispora scoriae]